MKRVDTQDFLNRVPSIPILDVRSPGEYKAGHIPSAISFPLFTDKERAMIGTLYKQEGRRPAMKKGLEIAGPKMPEWVERAEALESDSIALYCWRGGMRSESMAWLLERYDLRTTVLSGGYKAYRNHMLQYFEQVLPLHVITGYTGSKKTELLHLLKEYGEQVVDLEGLAGHQGSSYGNKKCVSQPSTEHFQNLVFEVFREMDTSRPIWIEDESMRIGTVNMTETLFRQISRSPHYFLEIPKAQRVEFLLEDYGELSDDQLIEATHAIRKKLGYNHANKAIQSIKDGDRKTAADIILTYYDSRYFQTISEKKDLMRDRISIDMQYLHTLPAILTQMTAHGV